MAALVSRVATGASRTNRCYRQAGDARGRLRRAAGGVPRFHAAADDGAADYAGVSDARQSELSRSDTRSFGAGAGLDLRGAPRSVQLSRIRTGPRGHAGCVAVDLV